MVVCIYGVELCGDTNAKNMASFDVGVISLLPVFFTVMNLLSVFSLNNVEKHEQPGCYLILGRCGFADPPHCGQFVFVSDLFSFLPLLFSVGSFILYPIATLTQTVSISFRRLFFATLSSLIGRSSPVYHIPHINTASSTLKLHIVEEN